MRFYLSLFLTLAFLSSLSAQHLGFRGGLQYTDLISVNDEAFTPFDAQRNVHFGAFLDVPISGNKLQLSPEISYAGRGYNLGSGSTGQNAAIEFNLNYLDVGALVKFTLLDRKKADIYVGAGPVVSYALNGNLEFEDRKQDIVFDGDFNRISASVAVVGGITIADYLFFEARYLRGLSSIEEDTPRGDRNSRFNSIGLSAGVLLPLTAKQR